MLEEPRRIAFSDQCEIATWGPDGCGAAPSPWLFPGAQGGLLDADWFTDRVWRPLQARAGLRYRTPHQARHTFATLLLQQGESLDYVKVQLGHSSIRVTADTYVHWLPGSNRGAVDRLDAPEPAPARNPRATETGDRLVTTRPA